MKRRVISVAVGVVIVLAITIFGNLFKIGQVEVEFQDTPVSVDVVDIYDNSDIELGQSILSLNENLVKRNIMNSYSDNAVAVTDIVRVFPNKVVIYCTEHVPMCAIEKKNDPNVYALADGDFQLNRVENKEDVDLSQLILLKGVAVDDTYNTETFRNVNLLFRTLKGEGISYNAQAKLFESVEYLGSKMLLKTRAGETVECDFTSSDVESAVREAYNNHFKG